MNTIAWMYILSNIRRTTLYVGATTDIRNRLWEHTKKRNFNSFSSRYNLSVLIYYEEFTDVDAAFEREAFVKKKSRAWKEELIKKQNPQWLDLSVMFELPPIKK